MTVRTRFAPSPTGYLHIGGVRTALFCWLFARRHGGQFILRIDDTDQQRNVEEALAPILHGLHWLGIDWDEGPEVGGPYGPYYQSQRGDRYRAAVEKLLASGAAFYDFATPEELQAEREAAEREKRNFLYSRRWMAETAADVARFEAEGRRPVVRLKMPREGTLVIKDVIRGDVSVDWAREQDHVIQRADGSCLYHLANVVDDYDFKISHVIRAEEHLSNTPRQVFIAQSLGYELPVYAHLPFVAEPGSKTKLSKRKLDKYLKNPDFAALMKHGRKVADALKMEVDPNTFNPVVVDFYEQVGYLPDAINNYLALLGWSLDDQTEYFSGDELIKCFTLERVNKATASFDPKKLWAFQDRHMQRLPVKKKVELVVPYLQRAGLVTSPALPAEQLRIVNIVRAAGDRIKTAGDILDFPYFFLSSDLLPLDSRSLKELLPTEDVAKRLRDCRDTIQRTSGRSLEERQRALATLSPTTSDTTTTTPPPGHDLLADWGAAEQIEAGRFEETFRNYVSENAIKLADVIHKVRYALTGTTKGLGLFETIEILGTEDSVARIDRALREAGYSFLSSPIPGTEWIAAIPEATKELYDFSDLNRPILLREGDFKLQIGENQFASRGRLELTLTPMPAISFSLVADSQHWGGFGNTSLTVPGLLCDVPVLITSSQIASTSRQMTVTGVPNSSLFVTVGQPKLRRVTFHLTDFCDYAGSGVRSHDSTRMWAGRLTLKSQQWTITVDAVPGLRERLAKASEYVPITHVGLLVRSDGEDFSEDEAKRALDATRRFLSLVRGQWVATLLSEGFDELGNCVWRDWTLWRCRTVRGFDSWCPIRDVKYVEAFFPEFLRRWSDPGWRELIDFAISRYLESNKQGQVDTSLVSARIVIEAIGGFVENELGADSGDPSKPLHNLELIADVLKRAGITDEIPDRLFRLRDFAAVEGIGSAVGVLTRIRNASIHPTKEAREFLSRLALTRHAFFDAARLAIWQSELCLLWLLGFTGRYQSRVHAEWVGETEAVPWEEPLRFVATQGAITGPSADS